jgi:hypothetical protein
MGAQVAPQQPIGPFKPLQNLTNEKCVTKLMIGQAFKETFSLLCTMVAHQHADRDTIKGWLRGPKIKHDIAQVVDQIGDRINSMHQMVVDSELTAQEINLNYIYSKLCNAQKILEQELDMLGREQRLLSAKCIILASLLDRTGADALCENGEQLNAAVDAKISQEAATLRARYCTIS